LSQTGIVSPQTAGERLLRSLPRLRGRDREGACNKNHASVLTPSPTLPRKRGREHTECGEGAH